MPLCGVTATSAIPSDHIEGFGILVSAGIRAPSVCFPAHRIDPSYVRLWVLLCRHHPLNAFFLFCVWLSKDPALLGLATVTVPVNV